MTYFNHERFHKHHADKCSNMVKEGNLIDSLMSTGGFSKEIKRRLVTKTINLAKLFEAKISATKTMLLSKLKIVKKKLYHFLYSLIILTEYIIVV